MKIMYTTNKKRHAFNNQPAQYVIIDVGYPITGNFLENTKKAIQNVLCLAASIQGSARVPCFGCSILNDSLQPVIKPIAVRGRCTKFLNPLRTISSNMVQLRRRISATEYKDFMHFALVSALDEFHEYCTGTTCFQPLKARNSAVEMPPQVQITIVTAKNGNEIQSTVESIVPNLVINKLKKIQIIQLLEDVSTDTKSPKGNVCDGFVELIKISGSERNLENLFKSWLIDCNKNTVEVNIKLPGLLLKCDTVECLVDINNLGCAPRLQLQTDVFSNNHMSGYAAASNEVPLYELEVINRLSSDGLDESMLFGQPTGLIPTKCLRLDWSELQYNKQHFSGLCQSLAAKQEYLIAKIQTANETPSGHFVLLPGPGMLLAKSIATAELILPTPDTKLEQISQTTMNTMLSCLSRIDRLQEYNASQFHAGLYAAITQSSNVQKNEELHNEAPTSVAIKKQGPKRSKTSVLQNFKRSLIETKRKQVEMLMKH